MRDNDSLPPRQAPENRLTQESAGAGSGKYISRWKASAIHLSISLAIAFTVLLALLEIWYPPPLFQAAGGMELLFILVGVDVVIGPLATLVIFDPAKKKPKELGFDLAVIALLQFSALLYGVHTMMLARPAYIVFSVDRFDVVPAKDILPEDLAKVARPEFTSLPYLGPKLAASTPPTDPREQEKILFSSIGGGVDIQAYPQYYVSYESAKHGALAKSIPLATLMIKHPESKSELAHLADSLGRKIDELRILPVRAKARDFTALIDAESGTVVGYALVDPW
jgi:hypothetical protein